MPARPCKISSINNKASIIEHIQEFEFDPSNASAEKVCASGLGTLVRAGLACTWVRWGGRTGLENRTTDVW